MFHKTTEDEQRRRDRIEGDKSQARDRFGNKQLLSSQKYLSTCQIACHRPFFTVSLSVLFWEDERWLSTWLMIKVASGNFQSAQRTTKSAACNNKPARGMRK